MALSKRFLKSKPMCKVGFKVASEQAQDCDCVSVAGEFSDWKPTPMRKLKDGSFSLTMDLETGRRYEFRYVMDGRTWMNDPDADDYRWNDYAGEENSVIDL